MEYKVNDQWLNASVFIPFVNKVWPGDYDEEKTQSALSKTLNISAYENNVLCRLPADSFRRLFLWHNYRTACSSRISETWYRQQAPPAC